MAEKRAGNPNWQKGQSGNPGGRPQSQVWRNALLAEGGKIDADALGLTRIQRLATVCFNAAMDGDMTALKEIAYRYDGNMPQPQIVTGDENGGPVVHKHILGFKSDI